MKKKTNKTNSDNNDASVMPLRFGRMARNLISAMPLGVVIFDRQLKITDINANARRIIAPADNLAKALANGLKQDDEQEWTQRLRKAMDASQSQTFDNISYSNNGTNRVLHVICTPLTDEESSRQIGGMLLIEDITAKIMMENDLANAERLAALGRLAARVAHELNNPLDGILRYINLALRVTGTADSQQSTKYLNESRKGLLRMVRIISELLEFSRSTYSAFLETDINKIVEESVKTMESHIIENDIQVQRYYGRNMPDLRCGNLIQVFCNLIKNAVDAMDKGGTLTVKTYCRQDRLLIEIADTGCGLSQEVRKKLFEPFFTTKKSGKGTGLGLAICKDIVERYNGQIIAKNKPEGGTIFTISIPLPDKNTRRVAQASSLSSHI